MHNPTKSEFGDYDRILRASMTNLVSEIENWEGHLFTFLSTSFVYGSAGLSTISCQGHMHHLDTLSDIIQDMCSIFNASFVRAASRVRHRRNSLARINFLPDEVLLPIFHEATHNHPHRKINVLLTCSRWRDICSSDSSFWGRFLVPSSTRNALRAISAAQGRPLNLTVDFKTWNNDIQNAISQRESTVRCLTARRVSVASKDTTSWLATSLSALRELTVESGTAYSWGDCILPPSIPSRRLPLESLSLLNCRFPYLKQCYSGLRTLSIVYHAPPVLQKEDSLHDSHLLAVLRASPHLEYLALCHPPMSVHEALAAPSRHPVPLPMLRRLRLQFHVQKIASLLTAIETSSETLYSVDIELTDMNRWAGHERLWHKPLLTAPLTPFSSTPAQSLPMLAHLDSFAMRYGRSVLGRGPARLRPSGQHAPASFRLTFSGREPEPKSKSKSLDDDNDDDVMRAAFDDFLAFLAFRNFLDDATRLRLEGFPSSEHALRILRAAPRVTTLAIHADPTKDGGMPVDILNCIARTHRHSLRPIAPQLEAVALVGCTVDPWTLADLAVAVMSLDLRVVSLERCESDVEEGEIIARLRGDPNDNPNVNDGLDVRWVEDDPRYELRV